jgi:predicted DNA-binding transcriptional regulator YafY
VFFHILSLVKYYFSITIPEEPEPSISGLIVAIAQGKIATEKSLSLEDRHVQSLELAIKVLVDTGYLRDAQILVQLLQERGKLTPDRRQSLLNLISQPNEGWRLAIDTYIAQKQPFWILYKNAQGETLEYQVRYAQINFHEKRFFVNVWCEETADIADTPYPELIHNRCLRLDRIQGLQAIPGNWREEGLDTLLVQLHFYENLVKSYQFRNRIDEREEFEGDNLRKVWRRVFNPLWLIREILPYGANCEVVSPESIRQKIKSEIDSMRSKY